MPSVRKKISGIIRAATAKSPTEASTFHFSNFEELSTSCADAESFIQLYLQGKLRICSQPDVYYDKAGTDIPNLRIIPPCTDVPCGFYSSIAGPDSDFSRITQLRVAEVKCANLANLDDELSLSMVCDAESSDDLRELGLAPDGDTTPPNTPTGQPRRFDTPSTSSVVPQNWDRPHSTSFGLSTSLYEKNPITEARSGDPIADVFATCTLQQTAVLVLADGVNWGEKSRIAARCAVRGAIDHVCKELFSSDVPVCDTMGIFHCLLQAFQAGHQLILQEAGGLTTLCVTVVTRLHDSDSFVACSCNVGDSLAFVYSPMSGVRELTFGSHDVSQMRDMRDAGGALGPVQDGVLPELHNLTCSMSVVDPGDIVFLTSDGISDNFDPVVGKFCIANSQPTQLPYTSVTTDGNNRVSLMETECKTTVDQTCVPGVFQNDDKIPNPSLPFDALPMVEAFQRHELMLLRMEDLLRYGVTEGDKPVHTAEELCTTLINFAKQLTMAKRRVLEDPDCYSSNGISVTTTAGVQKLRRRLMRERAADLPGKLDHASVCAYSVGVRGAGHSPNTAVPISPSLALSTTPTPLAADVEDESHFFQTEQSTEDTTSPISSHSPPLAASLPPLPPPLAPIAIQGVHEIKMIDETSSNSSSSIGSSHLIQPLEDALTPRGDFDERVEDAVQLSERAMFDTAVDDDYASTTEDYSIVSSDLSKASDRGPEDVVMRPKPLNQTASASRLSAYYSLPVPPPRPFDTVSLASVQTVKKRGDSLVPGSNAAGNGAKKKKHSRGSVGRHTIGIDSTTFVNMLRSTGRNKNKSTTATTNAEPIVESPRRTNGNWSPLMRRAANGPLRKLRLLSSSGPGAAACTDHRRPQPPQQLSITHSISDMALKQHGEVSSPPQTALPPLAHIEAFVI